jgi:hypothetical protein
MSLRKTLVVAFDLDVTMMWLHDRDATGNEERHPEVAALNDLVSRASQVLIVPTVLKDLETRGISARAVSALPSVTVMDDGQEMVRGCAKGRAERYVDLHPDPRDCRAVAEAECAHADVFVTLNNPLLTALAGRTDRVAIANPSSALQSG